MLHQVILPNLGIDDQSVTLSVWLVKKGAQIGQGEPVVEVLCGGVTVDLPAPADGILVQKLVAEGASISPGQPLATLEST
jgi:pyruvate/2-oxoglutarate dehydrogenase complex dihydrolipoamide acyltransferase (E2) component